MPNVCWYRSGDVEVKYADLPRVNTRKFFLHTVKQWFDDSIISRQPGTVENGVYFMNALKIDH